MKKSKKNTKLTEQESKKHADLRNYSLNNKKKCHRSQKCILIRKHVKWLIQMYKSIKHKKNF